MEQAANANVLQKLNNTDLTLSDSATDLRGFKVIDRSGQEIGHISDLFIDERERNVRMLQVSAGGVLGLGDRHFLVPVEAIVRFGNGEVQVDQTVDRVVNSPAYNPNLISRPAREYWEPIYGYYGILPYWTAVPLTGEERLR
jgi:sporulation protein YlmC with PRC-barrel domain